ncbi:alpha beta hydrolase fold-3 domain containing protein [Grosmannia clavigera kw1407]|uniref:Alpha beta hydrolase fold-3 domain containing protein n=1 Tax=Grosmannia clavigera (strain kw1407 / UAMH 11150) TaxID=655863 RepID=F0XPB4_GROCL|nr:alpha beta hydrolase fold-3 domain containing protein [Grosmannia clavigera kw1407]EFX00403.1 alpha beta hydrolase fold-3 domain containing protein [Grosmannia clavigera kw1407]
MGSLAEDVVVNPIHPSVEGMLSEQTKNIYNQYQSRRLRADQVRFADYDLDRARYAFPRAEVASPFCPVGETTVHRVPVTEPAGEIELQIYRPTSATPGALLPLYVDYHGGGFVLGSLADDDPLCRQVCQGAGCIVANVAYRLAPEFPHPVPTTDSWTALCWLVAHAADLGVDPSRIAIGGLSAGGCIAASLAQMARDDVTMPPLRLQALIVPVLDARYMPVVGGFAETGSTSSKPPYDSYLSCEFAPMLPIARLVWFYNLWLGTGPDRDQRAADVRASPITAPSLSGLAPASFHVAEVDPLRSEAVAYHDLLLNAGVPSQFHLYKGTCHPFGQWDGKLDAGKEFIRDLSEALKVAFK